MRITLTSTIRAKHSTFGIIGKVHFANHVRVIVIVARAIAIVKPHLLVCHRFEEGVRLGQRVESHILMSLKGDDISVFRFTEKDVVRHRLVQEIIKAYEKAAHPEHKIQANQKGED